MREEAVLTSEVEVTAIPYGDKITLTAASPVIRRRIPQTSSVESADTPSGGRICGRMAARKKICVDPVSTTRHTVASSRSDVRRSPAARASRGLPGGTPHATSAEQAQSIAPPRTKDRRNPRRAATTAPTAGPSTCPSVMPDWI